MNESSGSNRFVFSSGNAAFDPASRISNEAGRCQEVFSSFFASLNLFLFSIEHTRALAQERSFPSGIFFRRRSLFRVHPTRSAPYPFITAVWPTKHLFDPDGS
jgi:hypothetical protein